MVFGIDNKLITSIEGTSGLSMALNLIVWKQKWDEIDSDGPSKNVIPLSKTFERLITILAQALIRSKRVLSLPISTPIPTAANTGSTRSSRVANSLALDKKIFNIEDYIKKQMETWKNDM